MVERRSYSGILPAMQVPMLDNMDIDEAELRRFSRWLAGFEGVNGLVTNGHTGEVFSFTARERAEVTRIVVDAVEGSVPVISGLACEGIRDGVEHAEMAREAGADGLLVMPFHHWLRFGHRPQHVLDYFTALGEASGLNLVVHVYPRVDEGELQLGASGRTRPDPLGDLLQGRHARDVAIRARHRLHPRERARYDHPDLPRRISPRLDGAGRGRCARRFRLVHSRPHRGALRGRQGGRPAPRAGDTGADPAAQGSRLFERRALRARPMRA